MRKLSYLISLLLALCLTSNAQLRDSERDYPESAILLSKYAKIASVSGDEEAANEFLLDTFKGKGFYTELISSDKEKGYNFAASIYPLSDVRPNIVFLNHMDVVPPGEDSLWSHPAFSGDIADGKVWGRGVIDMKAMTIMQMLAVEEIHKASINFPYNLTILCVSGEEKNSRGARTVIGEYINQLHPIVIFGEGGVGMNGLSPRHPDKLFFTISVAEKKALWLKLTLAAPSSGHGSVPPTQYANKEMVKVLNRILNLPRKLRFNETNIEFFKALAKEEKGINKFVLSNPRFFKPFLKAALKEEPIILATLTNTITLTRIYNPEVATNQIAQNIEVILDCRLLPSTNKDEFINRLYKITRSSGIEISTMYETPAANPSLKDEYYYSFKDAIETIYPNSSVVSTLFPAYTDNTFFRNYGIPVYGVNPTHLSMDQLRSIHNINEMISIEQLERGRQVYLTFLESLQKDFTISKTISNN